MLAEIKKYIPRRFILLFKKIFPPLAREESNSIGISQRVGRRVEIELSTRRERVI